MENCRLKILELQEILRMEKADEERGWIAYNWRRETSHTWPSHPGKDFGHETEQFFEVLLPLLLGLLYSKIDLG